MRSQEINYHHAVEVVKKIKSIETPLKSRKFAGREGGLAPAQGRMPLNLDLRIQGQGGLEMADVDLICKCAGRILNSNLNGIRS